MKKRKITVRVTDEEHALLSTRAAAYNESVSEYVRNTALRNQKRSDTRFIKIVKPIIRNIQTSCNMIRQNIDVENQTTKISQEVQKLCQISN